MVMIHAKTCLNFFQGYRNFTPNMIPLFLVFALGLIWMFLEI